MNALFQYIKAAILARYLVGTAPNTKPFFKKVVLWNSQTTRERLDKAENPFPTPWVGVEFITTQVDNFSLGIKNVHLTVRFHFGLQSMKMERDTDFDILDEFDYHIQGLHAVGPVYFSSFQEQALDPDENRDNLNEPILDYTTIWRKTSAYARRDQISHGPVTPQINVDLVPNLDPEPEAEGIGAMIIENSFIVD